MRSHAVVLTYPAHLLHTVQTIRSIQRWHPEIQDYTVILDDVSNLAWPGYITEASEIYHDLGCSTKTSSSLDFAHSITYPWVRQQTIKLYLDEILDFDHWFFSDGDCELLGPWPENFRSAHPVPWGEISQGFCEYVGSMLDLGNWPGRHDVQGRYVTTSAPPTRDMQSENLQRLRQHILDLHGMEIWEIHVRRQRQPDFKPSEWELMDYFDLDLQKSNIEIGNLRHRVTMSWECDRQRDLASWRDLGIKISESLWQKLPLVRYI